MNLIDLAVKWENWARRKWYDAEREKDPMGKRLIEHGALCYQNCASELREALTALSLEPSTMRREVRRKRKHRV